MAWVKLDDAMPHHPKVMAAGPEAFALDVAGICYSNKHATDGFIAEASLPAVFPALRNPKRWALKLVEVGRWVEVDGGWQIHDVADYQPSAAEAKAISRKRAEAGRIGGLQSGKTRAKPKQDASEAVPKGKQDGSEESNPDPTRPDPEDAGSSDPVENGIGGVQGGNADFDRILVEVAFEHADRRIADGYQAKSRDALAHFLKRTDAAVANEARQRMPPAPPNVLQLLEGIGRPIEAREA
jgi:hypothetical protein